MPGAVNSVIGLTEQMVLSYDEGSHLNALIHLRKTIKQNNEDDKMRKISFTAAIVFAFFIFTAPGQASTVWLDEVIEFIQPDGSSFGANDPTQALGPADAVNPPDPNNYKFVAIDRPEILILAFTDNTAYDGPGADLKIYEFGADTAVANVSGSMNGTDWVFLGQFTSSDVFDEFEIDLATTGLSYVNFLQFEGRNNRGNPEGFDLDAVEALNSGVYIPIPGAVWLLGSGLAGLVILRRRKS
jgi:hypothetical protein